MIRYYDGHEGLVSLERGLAAVLVYFYSDNCAPCKALRPKVEEMILTRFPQMDLLYIDASAHPLLAGEYHAFSLPVLIVFFEGKELRRFSKYVSPAELEGVIGRYYDLYFS